MGIPSYFSYIVKNHPTIIKRLSDLGKRPHNLYLDSNSIIYDCLRRLTPEYSKYTDGQFETKIIDAMCVTIDGYIKTTKPSKTVFIAFDGVAPFAKMEQQKNRRYKSALDAQIKQALHISTPKTWDKTAITPGTKFMKKMGTRLNSYYKTKAHDLGVKHVMISDSRDAGEGEHKIFAYIRDNPDKHKKETSFIYGLDADLIMLGLNHLPLSKNLYLYRETPEFIKSINRNLEPNETYVMDLPVLAEAITSKMNNYMTANKKQQTNRLYDYIFLCFFLGNDFMPHFPAINIRTRGVDTMLSAYQNTIGKTNENLTDGKTIYWKNVRKLVSYLAESEEGMLKNEYKIRTKWARRHYPTGSDEEKLFHFSLLPTRERTKEKMIDPFNRHWQQRYYKILFDTDISHYYSKQISINYLEGLEWTMKYYTTGCVDWKWGYRYHYPPLLNDLVKYIPHWETQMIEKNNHQPVHPYVQLAYVLPDASLGLLPPKIRKKLREKYGDYYGMDKAIAWSFCKYFWESHVDFEYMNFEDLEKTVMGLC